MRDNVRVTLPERWLLKNDEVAVSFDTVTLDKL